MRKIILFNFVTLDGFFAGPNGELDWHLADEEFIDFSIEQLNAADLLLFGRVTYELMVNYWTMETVRINDPIVANKMNNYAKIVFSRTLKKAAWNNTRLVNEKVAEELARVKQQPGKNILLLGSADLTQTLMDHHLVDEYRVMVNPVILGNGKPMFKRSALARRLKLLSTKTFRSGNVLLCYQ